MYFYLRILLSSLKKKKEGLIIPISDKHLIYTELLFVAKPEFEFGYWDGDKRKGFQHTLNAFKFDSFFLYFLK